MFLLAEKNIITHDSCINVIHSHPNELINATITDFPYGIDYQSNHRKEKFAKIKNDERPYIEWIEPLFDKTADEGRLICFYRFDVQDELFDEIERVGWTIKSQLVWDKDNWTAGDLDSAFGLQHELMVYATKGRYIFKNGRPSSVYRCPRVGHKQMIHPNEKPIELNKALIRDVTEENELLFEPFSGSASMPCASKILGRDFIATELMGEHVITGNRRLAMVKRSLI